MTFTKEDLIEKAREQIAFCRHTKITGEGRTHVNQCSALFEIALAALESRADADQHIRREVNVGGNTWVQCSNAAFEKAKSEGKHVRELYERPQPAPAANTCPKCGGTGMADSGGVQPWGEPIEIPCDCSAAMLQGKAEPVSQPYTLPADYLQGHKDGCEWAARMAEANHPQTGDWLFDDPIELAKAIRKGPDMLPAPHKQDFREIPNSSTNNCRENADSSTKCWCHTCRPVTMTDMRFVVCPECGNKRCPHANDHRNACTGSNAPGQEGSAYPDAPKQEAE